MVKLYKDPKWLRWAFYQRKYSPEEIAKMTGSSTATIYRYLKQFKLI